MQDLFLPRHFQVLEKFALLNTLVALDFDGTLAPIVRSPQRAAIRKYTRSLLARLARIYPCVVISGRARNDVRRRLLGIGIRGIVGNHGVETSNVSPALAESTRCWMPLLTDNLRRFRGVVIEDNGFSVTIHYLRAPRKRQARIAIAETIRRLGTVRVVGGKEVVNILPAEGPHKGLALKREMEKFGCSNAIYIGDDETDEDVFALPGRARLLTIRVGLNRNSLAQYYIRTQGEINRVIQTLVDLRSRPLLP